MTALLCPEPYKRGMRKRLALILTAALGIAACGSTSNHNPKTAATGFSQALAFSKCMRTHGVPNFPDPTSGGGGIQLSIGVNSGINPRSPTFQSAQTACQHLQPGGGPSFGRPSAQAVAQALEMAQCMRAHGISGFPDPTTHAPSSPAGFGLVMGRDGVFLTLPRSIDPRSPAFQRAAATCHFGPRSGVPKSL